MPSSVKGAKVSKTRAKSTSSQSTASRSRSRQQGALSQTLNFTRMTWLLILHTDLRPSLPLVERTNRLSIEQFIASYIEPGNGTGEILLVREPGYTLDLYASESIPSVDFDACFHLIELTSSNDYDGSSVGWSPSKKRKEMKLPDMKYILIRRAPLQNNNDEITLSRGDILGFLSFMVTYEDGKEVIYCYEIHLTPTAQGRGLGQLLMEKFQDIGRRVGLEKAMLTVFKSNSKAMRLYERLGYSVDECSPQPRSLRNGTVKEPDYLILSKPLKGTAS